MALLDISNLSVPSSQPMVSSENSLIQNPKITRPKLSMIWVKEFDGERQRLVARWVTILLG